MSNAFANYFKRFLIACALAFAWIAIAAALVSTPPLRNLPEPLWHLLLWPLPIAAFGWAASSLFPGRNAFERYGLRIAIGLFTFSLWVLPGFLLFLYINVRFFGTRL